MAARRGFPEGHKALEQSAEWYERAFRSAKNQQGPYHGHWNALPHRTVTWYPALVLATGPILEIGCGSGHFAAMCLSYGHPYWCGIDFSAIAIELASKHAKGCKFRKLDVFGPEAAELFLSPEYSCVVALEVLEHVWDDLRVIRSIPKGRMVVGSVPNFHTEGHVRWFANEDQVHARYSRLLSIERIVKERAAKPGNEWFIFRGRRKE